MPRGSRVPAAAEEEVRPWIIRGRQKGRKVEFTVDAPFKNDAVRLASSRCTTVVDDCVLKTDAARDRAAAIKACQA